MNPNPNPDPDPDPDPDPSLIDALRPLSAKLGEIDELGDRVDDLDAAIDRHRDRDRDRHQDRHRETDPVFASDYGFDGDGEGGDLAAFVRDHIDRRIVLDGGAGAVYSVRSEIDIPPGDARLAIESGDRSPVRLRIDSDDVDTVFRIGDWGDGIAACRIAGIEIDLDGHDAGVGRFFVDGRLEVSDVALRGRRDRHAQRGDKFSYLSCITSVDGFGVHRRVRLPDGDVWTGDTANSHAIGFAADPPHIGVQIWESCYVAEHWDNGFYVRNSPGANVLVAPYAANCGRSNIRLGARDTAIEPTSVWDLNPDHDHYPVGVDGGRPGFGTLLASDGDGAMIVGGVAISLTGQNDLVRTWGGSGRFLMAGTEIINETDQWSIRASVNPSVGGDDRAIARIENVTIRENSAAEIRGAAVCSMRENLQLDGISYTNIGETQSRAFLEVDDGCSATVRDSHIESGSDAIVRLRSSPDTVAIDRCTVNGGIDLGDDASIAILRVTDCDAREAPTSALFVSGPGRTSGADAAGAVDAIIDRDNIGIGAPTDPDGSGSGSAS